MELFRVKYKYRQISLTSHLSKTFERILARHIMRITSHIWTNNSQYGFLHKKGTMDAIIQVLDDLAVAKDQREAVTAIFFDFDKAFDLVDHEVLLSKLKRLVNNYESRMIERFLFVLNSLYFHFIRIINC